VGGIERAGLVVVGEAMAMIGCNLLWLVKSVVSEARVERDEMCYTMSVTRPSPALGWKIISSHVTEGSYIHTVESLSSPLSQASPN
jgi:hypothetical protein